MEAQVATQLAVQRLTEGSSHEQIIAELLSAGVPDDAARALVGGLGAQQAEARAREVAVELLKAGASKAATWEALVAKGVAPDVATALVGELGELRDRAQARPAPAPLPSVYSSPYASGAYHDGSVNRGQLITGFVLFTLGLIVTVGTCSEAEGGGHYVLAWGPMAAGISIMIRSLSKRR